MINVVNWISGFNTIKTMLIKKKSNQVELLSKFDLSILFF
jgi:hypothetical protein